MYDILLCIVYLVVAKLIAELLLEGVNRWSMHCHQDKIPAFFEGLMDAAMYRKSIDYSVDKSHLNELEALVRAGVVGGVFYFQGLPVIFSTLSGLLGTGLWSMALTVAIVQALFMLPFLPVQLWGQFSIEAKYGFNRSTLRLWVVDRIKVLGLLFLLGTPLFAGLMAFYKDNPQTWWMWGAGLLIAFKVILMVVYPRLILPLFNKLTPMPEGELKERLMALADRAGFKAKTIEVLDGSRRSGHSNAFFTGFGPFRRIVFYDTLLTQLAPKELEAVLAHEIGHYKRGHVVQRMVMSSLLTVGGLWLMNWGLSQSSLFYALGFEPGSEALWLPAFFIFGGWLLELATFWLSPLFSGYSRIHEYQADRFAREAVGTADTLISALKKLHKENLANLVPHPIYSAFYYSHPTLMERESALRKS